MQQRVAQRTYMIASVTRCQSAYIGVEILNGNLDWFLHQIYYRRHCLPFYWWYA